MKLQPSRRAALPALGLTAMVLAGGCQSPARSDGHGGAAATPSLYGVSMAIGTDPRTAAPPRPAGDTPTRPPGTADVAAVD